MKTKIKPLHNHVVLKQQEEQELTRGNIIVPDMGKDKPLLGEVIASGPGIINLNGVLIPNIVTIGSIVIFPAFGGQKMTVNGEEYIVCKEQDLIAVLEDAPVEIPNRLSNELVSELVSDTTLPQNSILYHK